MSLQINKVTLAGNLTRDPDIRVVGSDRHVANFGLAVNRRFKDASGEKKEEATFVDVEAWGRTAELIGQYLHKGDPVFLEGRLKLDQWQDAKTNEKRSKLKVVADNIQFLSKAPGKGDNEPIVIADDEPAPVSAAAAGTRKRAALPDDD